MFVLGYSVTWNHITLSNRVISVFYRHNGTESHDYIPCDKCPAKLRNDDPVWSHRRLSGMRYLCEDCYDELWY